MYTFVYGISRFPYPGCTKRPTRIMICFCCFLAAKIDAVDGKVSPFLVTADSFFFASWRGLGDAMLHPKCGFQAGYALLGIRTNGINTNMFKWISGGAYPPRDPYQPYARNLYQAGYTPLEIHTRSIKHCVLQMDIRRGIPSSVSAPETQNATCAKWIPGGVYPLRNLHQRSRLVLLPSSNP